MKVSYLMSAAVAVGVLLMTSCTIPVGSDVSTSSIMSKDDFERTLKPTHVAESPDGVEPIVFESYQEAAEFVSAMRNAFATTFRYPEGYFASVQPGATSFHFDTKIDRTGANARSVSINGQIQGIGKTLTVYTKGKAHFNWGYVYDGSFLRYVKQYTGVSDVYTWVEGYVIGATYQTSSLGSGVSFGTSSMSMTLTGRLVVYYTVNFMGTSSMSSESGSATAYFGQ